VAVGPKIRTPRARKLASWPLKPRNDTFCTVAAATPPDMSMIETLPSGSVV
jgi:hypothetical protein